MYLGSGARSFGINNLWNYQTCDKEWYTNQYLNIQSWYFQLDITSGLIHSLVRPNILTIINFSTGDFARSRYFGISWSQVKNSWKFTNHNKKVDNFKTFHDFYYYAWKNKICLFIIQIGQEGPRLDELNYSWILKLKKELTLLSWNTPRSRGRGKCYSKSFEKGLVVGKIGLEPKHWQLITFCEAWASWAVIVETNICGNFPEPDWKWRGQAPPGESFGNPSSWQRHRRFCWTLVGTLKILARCLLNFYNKCKLVIF